MKAEVIHTAGDSKHVHVWAVSAAFRYRRGGAETIETCEWQGEELYALVRAESASEALEAARASVVALSDRRLLGWLWDNEGQRTLVVCPVEDLHNAASFLPSGAGSARAGIWVCQLHVPGRRALPVFMFRP